MPFVSMLSGKQQQMLKKHEFHGKAPYWIRSTASASPLAQWIFSSGTSKVLSSHIYRAVWLSTLPSELRFDFFRDKCGLPNYRFTKSLVIFIFICYFFFVFEGFGLVPLFVYTFPFFLLKFEIGYIGWRFYRIPT